MSISLKLKLRGPRARSKKALDADTSNYEEHEEDAKNILQSGIDARADKRTAEAQSQY